MASRNIENIKERLSIEEVVGQYVELKPAGSSLKGKCPFHAEKTPSFMVSPMRQSYHCFGCGVGGDIFTFVQEIEGLDFKGSLKALADKAGIELVYEKGVEKDDNDVLFSILESVTQYYTENLKKNDKAITYLKDRGLTDETIDSFRIGFAPDSWSGAYEHLKGAGFSEKHIMQAGLIKEGTKGSYDRFRSRIMFPVADSVGRIVAFSGRIFDKEDDNTGKYINSPETPLYHKSKILYGYDRARQAIRKANFAVLVEGQMDLIATHQAKYNNTVALSGTALTPEHITLLGRMSKNLCIALDADAAGIASAGKSARAALRSGFDVKIAALPEGSDPADMLVNDDIELWKNTIKDSKHIIDFLLNLYRKKSKDERAFKLMVQKEVLPYVLDIESEIDKSHFIQRVAAQLSVGEEAVRRELSKLKATPINEGIAAKPATQKGNDTPLGSEDELVLMYLWQKDLKEQLVDCKRLKVQIEEALTPIGFKALEEKLAGNKEAAFKFEALYHDEDSMKRAINELIERLLKRELQKELDNASVSMRKAESEGNQKDIALYAQKHQDVLEKLRKLDNHL
ncbi:DNA primase [Candidatus Kaiserbacteria bacterium]|nr:MAG: DNA primase [Candidatus Kaiserbacteria bacterium]